MYPCEGDPHAPATWGQSRYGAAGAQVARPTPAVRRGRAAVGTQVGPTNAQVARGCARRPLRDRNASRRGAAWRGWTDVWRAGRGSVPRSVPTRARPVYPYAPTRPQAAGGGYPGAWPLLTHLDKTPMSRSRVELMDEPGY
jgi:hypothetical protein